MKYLSEREDDYPTFRMIGFDDEDIKRFKLQMAEKFKGVNRHIAQFNRPPLFPDPDDVDASVELYQDLLKDRPYRELVEFFGTSYEDYQPAVLPERTV